MDARPAAPAVELVLLHPPGHEAALPLPLLAEALCRHHVPGVAVASGPSARSVSFHVPWEESRAGAQTTDTGRIFKALRDGLKERPRQPSRYLLSATACQEETGLDGVQCLILAPAHHEGLRDTYARLKALAGENQPALVGITICHAASSRAARQHYHKLATAAQRFLGLHVASYGALPPTPPPWAVVEPQATADEESIHHIARMVIQDWQDYQQSLSEERTPT